MPLQKIVFSVKIKPLGPKNNAVKQYFCLKIADSKIDFVRFIFSAMADTNVTTTVISNQYKESKQFKLIELILKKYGKEGDINDIIEQGKELGLIQKTGKSSGKEKTQRGASKWTAFQKECKRRAAAEGKPGLKQARIKEIWNSEDYSGQHSEWERVADELNSGKSFKEVSMPKIPDIDED